MTRMLIKIIGVDEFSSNVFVTIPAIDFTKLIKIGYQDLPDEVLKVVLDGQPYVHAEVEEWEDSYKFDCWEID